MIEIRKYFLTFLILGLVQIFVLNHICLFGCATPLIYVYFILSFPPTTPKWEVLVSSFLMGLFMDLFTNTPGVAAASATLLGFLQPQLLGLFSSKDSTEEITPTIKSLGLINFSYYVSTAVFIYCFILYSIEAFNFFNWGRVILSIFFSSILTILLIIVIENLRK